MPARPEPTKTPCTQHMHETAHIQTQLIQCMLSYACYRMISVSSVGSGMQGCSPHLGQKWPVSLAQQPAADQGAAARPHSEARKGWMGQGGVGEEGEGQEGKSQAVDTHGGEEASSKVDRDWCVCVCVCAREWPHMRRNMHACSLYVALAMVCSEIVHNIYIHIHIYIYIVILYIYILLYT